MHKTKSFQLHDYWHEGKKFYEEISFRYPFQIELDNSTIILAYNGGKVEHFLKFYYLLKSEENPNSNEKIDDLNKTADIVLFYDTNLEVIDEDWYVELSSPQITVKPGEQLRETMLTYKALPSLKNISNKISPSQDSSKLDKHHIWEEFEALIAQIDTNALVMDILDYKNFQIDGYWVDDIYYENISFVGPINSELRGCFISARDKSKPLLKFNYLLKVNNSTHEGKILSEEEKIIANIVLFYTPDLEFNDEIWDINMTSPFVIKKLGSP